MRNCHFCHCTRLPSTVKLGPSGCVIEIGFRSVAHARLVLGVVARPVRRQRRDAVVDHLDHLVAAHVEVHDQAFDRPRVAVVGRVVAQERDAARDAPPVFAVVAEHAGRPRVDLHVVEVGDPALGERGDVLGVLLGREDRARSPRSSAARAACRRSSCQSTISPVRRPTRRPRCRSSVGPGHDDARARAARPGSPGFHRASSSLCRLVQHDVREQRALGHAARRAHDLDRALDLVAREHLERMRDVAHRSSSRGVSAC